MKHGARLENGMPIFFFFLWSHLCMFSRRCASAELWWYLSFCYLDMDFACELCDFKMKLVGLSFMLVFPVTPHKSKGLKIEEGGAICMSERVDGE